MQRRSIRPSATLVRNLSFGLLLAGASPLHAQTACKPVYDALDKVMTQPTHIFRTVGPREGQGVQSAEAIYIDGAIYQRNQGDWTKINVTTAQAAKQEKDSRAGNKQTCKVVKDDDVNGEPATLYETHNRTETDTIDSQIWISKSKGLILKQEIDGDSGIRGKVHYSVRYEYENVVAPK
jgi:hypothetical protein